MAEKGNKESIEVATPNLWHSRDCVVERLILAPSRRRRRQMEEGVLFLP